HYYVPIGITMLISTASSMVPGRFGFKTGPPSRKGTVPSRGLSVMATSHSLHARFLLLLPRIEAHAKIYFRDVRCSSTRADRIAETVALAWKWFVRLVKRGKDAALFVSALAKFAVKAVKCGRRLTGMEKAKDVMNRQTQNGVAL